MGCAGSNLNETMAFIQAARNETNNNKVDTLMSQQFEITTSQNMAIQLQDLKLKAISEVIQNDANEELIELLRDGTLKINEQFGQLQVTALHVAAYYGSRKVLRSLLKYTGIDANVGNVDGDTPLMLAVISSASDSAALKSVQIFLSSNTKISVTKKNGNKNFPLVAAIRNGFKETAKLLASPRLITQYHLDDITIAIKIALRLQADDIAEFIAENVGQDKLRGLLSQITYNTKLYELAQDMEKTIISNQRNKRPSVQQKSVTSLLGPEERILEDAAENKIKIGNVVMTLSTETIRRSLPTESKDSKDLVKISDQKGIVHNIFDDKLYIELAESNCMAVISAKSVVFASEGRKLQVNDEQNVVVGSFVQVIENETKLKELQGESWRHGMEETCGRTGRVIRINKGVQVQFAWGPRFYYQPSTLVSSSDDQTETRDSSGNWLHNGCPVKVTTYPADFDSLQEEIGLPFNSNYQQIVGKYAQLGRVKIKPFSVQKIASVIWKGQEFNINIQVISLVTSVLDSTGVEIYEGDTVMLRKDASSVLKSLQVAEFGGWTDDMMKCIKLIGTVKEFRVDGRYEANGSMVKVDFGNGTCFYFNPKALVLHDEEKTLKGQDKQNADLLNKDGKIEPRTKTKVKQAANRVSLENINRESIACLEKLGEGGFGSVYKGTWTLEDGTTKTVAIKQMKYGVTSQNTYEDILKEASIQYTLNHPNIVSLFGISYAIEEQQLWLVMKLVQGQDLLSILFPSKGSPKMELSYKHKVKICLDISYAIAYIHDRLTNDRVCQCVHAVPKFIHMFSYDNGTKMITFADCDFGITRYLGTMDLQAYATRFTNSFGGTLLYVAPECLKQDKKGRYLRPTYKSDVWSLGASFFEIFTEKHLFDDPMVCYKCKAMNDSEYVQKHVSVFAPKEVRKIIQKTLEFLPNRRPHAYELTEFFHSL